MAMMLVKKLGHHHPCCVHGRLRNNPTTIEEAHHKTQNCNELQLRRRNCTVRPSVSENSMCGFVKLSPDRRSTHRSPWDAHKGLIMIRGQQNGDNSEIYRKQQQSENNSQEMNSEKVFWSAFMWGGGGGKASEEKTIHVEEDDDNSSRETQTTGAQVVATKLLAKSRISSACQKFLFHTADEGKVRVSVTHSATQYTVEIQADISNIQSQNCDVPLKLHWGLFRSDSTDWVLLEPEEVPSGTTYINGSTEAMQTPFVIGPHGGVQTLSLTFDAKMAPFIINFVLLNPASSSHREESWIRGNQGNDFCVPVGIRRGRPDSLGITWQRDGSVNFALYSKHANNVILCLYTADAIEPSLEIDLDQSVHRTGDVWHVQLESLEQYSRYGYRCKGQVGWETGDRFHARYVLLDPYAKFIAPHVAGQEDLPSPAPVLGWLKKEKLPFDWGDEIPPCVPLECLVAYRLNVGSFTGESSGLTADLQGTFLGLIEKVPHFHAMGVNTIILQPVFAHEEYRGCYYPISFFSVMGSYGPERHSLSASVALKKLVKELHRNGIEVILDVVYSHTAEDGDEAPKTISFRGIDNANYYILDKFGTVLKSDFGTANSFNCNHPIVQKLIIDSLRYLVEEFHVDGFCFSNASALVTGPHGQELSRPVLVEDITFDPLLASVKLIADACSPINGVCKEIRFPHWKRWCEWNTQFKTDVRRFIRGEHGQLSSFATRLCGSGDMFADGRGTQYSFNHVTAPYGFTLTDLVSYSWNCGHEGPTSDPAVIETRIKQVRNLLVTLFLSQGIPVLNMGDEYGHSKNGMVDVDRTSFQWDAVESEFGEQTIHLISTLSAFRKRQKELLQRICFLEAGMLTWHGIQPKKPRWQSSDSNFLAVSIHSQAKESELRVQTFGDLYLAFNAHPSLVLATIPEPPQNMTWVRIADSSFPYPDNFLLEGTHLEFPSPDGRYNFQPYSSVVLEARPVTQWHDPTGSA
ncbi:unnamed protein product [Sphagnum jensenii]|uniref:Glycosyl hydrolase family 13 catalytic domain-containing protein n=1 Tax=Sphagnum jensenii TaxID=128206 RepID=A0ABP0WU52_9BRYO